MPRLRLRHLAEACPRTSDQGAEVILDSKTANVTKLAKAEAQPCCGRQEHEAEGGKP